jgi:hypothetical protein
MLGTRKRLAGDVEILATLADLIEPGRSPQKSRTGRPSTCTPRNFDGVTHRSSNLNRDLG